MVDEKHEDKSSLEVHGGFKLRIAPRRLLTLIPATASAISLAVFLWGSGERTTYGPESLAERCAGAHAGVYACRDKHLDPEPRPVAEEPETPHSEPGEVVAGKYRKKQVPGDADDEE